MVDCLQGKAGGGSNRSEGVCQGTIGFLTFFSTKVHGWGNLCTSLHQVPFLLSLYSDLFSMISMIWGGEGRIVGGEQIPTGFIFFFSLSLSLFMGIRNKRKSSFFFCPQKQKVHYHNLFSIHFYY